VRLQLKHILEISRHDRPLCRGPFLALLGDMEEAEACQQGSQASCDQAREAGAKLRQVSEILAAGTADPDLHPVTAGFKTILLGVGGKR
jgi:hypothetical protein